MSTHSELHLVVLNREIAMLECEACGLKSARASLTASIANASLRSRYLRFVQWFRSPSQLMDSWPVVALLNGTWIIGVLVLLSMGLLLGFWETAAFGMLLSMFVAAGGIAVFLYLPSSAGVEIKISDADNEVRIQSARFEETIRELDAVNERHKVRLSERSQLLASAVLRREMLLQRDWKALRGGEWEGYLIEVCEALGATVRRTAGVGDQGVDIIVEIGPKCCAVQAKGYGFPVSNSAVQEAVAGVAHYGCNSSAVITNSRFTRGAKELAASNGCMLVGEEEFPDFVLGKISL